MFPAGYVCCKEVYFKSRSFIIYMHIYDDSKDSMTVYLTDAIVFYTTDIPLGELRRISAELNVKDDETIHLLQLSIKKELCFEETLSEITFIVIHGAKSSKLALKLHAVTINEEKEQCLKLLLFQLAKIVEDKCESPNFGKSELHSPTKHNPEYGLVSTLSPNKSASKRRDPGMSIINPASKRVKLKQGVQYEEEDSDS